MGGLPTPEQEIIFDQCRHAIVVTRTEAEHRVWMDLVQRHNLTVVADLRSDPQADGTRWTIGEGREVLGAISAVRLEPEAVLQAVADHLARLFDLDSESLFRLHLGMSPWPAGDVHVVNFDAWLRRLHTERRPRFQPADVPIVLATISTSQPIALYGRLWAPMVVQLAARRDVQWQFDVSHGWIQPPRVHLADAIHTEDDRVSWRMSDLDRHTRRLSVTLKLPNLEYASDIAFTAPGAPASVDLEIDGKLPMWMFSALGRAYAHCRTLRVRDLRAVS